MVILLKADHLKNLCYIGGFLPIMESSKIDYIQSKDNKTIKHIISLQQRKFRQKYSEYIVEGVRAVTDIAKKGSLTFNFY